LWGFSIILWKILNFVLYDPREDFSEMIIAKSY